MLIATNRCLNSDKLLDGVGPLDTFGETRERQLRFAHATRDSGEQWRIQLVQEGQESAAFAHATSVERQSCVLYVHGNNKSFGASLEQAATIEDRYKVGVLLFSWPSFTEHPEGQTDEERKINAYQNARTNAESSAEEFDAFLQLYSETSRSPDSATPHTLNLFTHSMGNYLLQNYVKSQSFSGYESKCLTNVVLSQADVNSEDHQQWLEKLIITGAAVYVTINRRDDRLALALKVLGSTRLGNTRPSVAYPGITYVDVTEGTGVESEHTIWGTAVNNDAVKSFFASVLNGKSVFAPTDTRWGSIAQLFAG